MSDAKIVDKVSDKQISKSRISCPDSFTVVFQSGKFDFSISIVSDIFRDDNNEE